MLHPGVAQPGDLGCSTTPRGAPCPAPRCAMGAACLLHQALCCSESTRAAVPAGWGPGEVAVPPHKCPINGPACSSPPDFVLSGASEAPCLRSLARCRSLIYASNKCCPACQNILIVKNKTSLQLPELEQRSWALERRGWGRKGSGTGQAADLSSGDVLASWGQLQPQSSVPRREQAVLCCVLWDAAVTKGSTEEDREASNCLYCPSAPTHRHGTLLKGP